MVLFNLPKKNNNISSVYEKQSKIEDKEQKPKKLETYDDIRRMILAENSENNFKNNSSVTLKQPKRKSKK